MLLDTHVLLWYLSDAPNLPRDVAAFIEEARLVYVSAASIWEISIKAASRKLRITGVSLTGYASVARIITECSDIPFELMPITAEQTAVAGFVRSPHRDPFDRILAAQAVMTGNPIVSADTAFDSIVVRRGASRSKVQRIWTPVRRIPSASS